MVFKLLPIACLMLNKKDGFYVAAQCLFNAKQKIYFGKI